MVTVIKVILWMVVLVSHLHMLWAQLIYEQGFLVGFTRSLQQVRELGRGIHDKGSDWSESQSQYSLTRRGRLTEREREREREREGERDEEREKKKERANSKRLQEVKEYDWVQLKLTRKEEIRRCINHGSSKVRIKTFIQTNRFYQIALMVFVGIPSLLLDVQSIKHLR